MRHSRFTSTSFGTNERHLWRSHLLLRCSVVFGCIVATVLTSSCAQPPAHQPNVIIVLVDTLRADRLSVDGFEQPTSPFLEKLAKQGAYFDTFYAHSAVTRPSVATLFTSRTMSGHGVVSRGFGRLPSELPLLAEVLQEHSIHTLAVVSNPQVHPATGFSRGFDEFLPLFGPDVDPDLITPGDLVKTPARDVFAEAQRAIEGLPPGPFFAYIHLLDPHGPYNPSTQHGEAFLDPAYDGNVTGSINDFARITRAGLHEGPDINQFQGLYLGEIRTVDAAIDGLVTWLRDSGLAETTHLIITSDHGEEFMEHGGTGHGRKLFQETVRVPLIWVGPTVPPGLRVSSLAGLIDLAPTITDLFGLSSQSEFQGRSMVPLLHAMEPESWRPGLLLEGPAGGRSNRNEQRVPAVLRSLLIGHHKLIAHGGGLGEPGWDRIEVFDLVADPNETEPRVLRSDEDLSEGDAALVRIYEHEVASMLASGVTSDVEQVELPAEDLERLRQLGYLQ